MLKLASIFTDGAVLQRNKAIPVWGQAAPDKLIEVTLGDQTSWAKATMAGRFITYLPQFTAGGPYDLTVKCEDETIVLHDIMIGEVWLAGGQSNMSYTLATNWTGASSTPVGLNEKQLSEFIETLDKTKEFRMFTVPHVITATKEETVDAKWVKATDDTVGEFSAVAAWFGRYLQEGLDGVPIGLINSSWGGTNVQTWTSTPALLREPLTQKGALLRNMKNSTKDCLNCENCNKSKEEVFKKLFDLDALYGENTGLKEGWAEVDFDDKAWKPFTVPGSWIAQGVAENGVLWVRIPVDIPQKWEGRELLLKMGGIDKTDITYFNGTEVGRTGERLDVTVWQKLRRYTIPAQLVKGGKNVIAVRALSFAHDGSFNGSRLQYSLECPEFEESIPLNGVYQSAVEKDLGRIIPPPANADDLNNPNAYGALFDSMIYPLLPYAIRGAIWYQGESNAAQALEYRTMLRNMIEDWRYNFQQGDFPFIQVQLANYREAASYDKKSTWAVLRDSQDKVCKDMKDVYMSTAIDIGDPCDIHPQDKKTVGKRLADNALHNVYGKSGIVPNGPMIRKAVREGKAVRLVFDFANGMYFPDGTPEGLGFFVAGSDDKFVPVDTVTLDGNTLLVSSKEVADPEKVCYSWSDNPDGNLRNGAGLPAYPFMIETEY